jgi:hypothetical protein
MFLKYVLIGFFLYFLFKFVVDFIIPVVRTTRQVKRQFDAVREQQQHYYQEKTTPTPSAKKSTSADKDDYLDFEEVK